MIVSTELSDLSKDNFEEEKQFLALKTPDVTIAFEGVQVKCFEGKIRDMALLELDGKAVGYLCLNKHMVKVEEYGHLPCYIPHIHLEDELRGIGFGTRIYQWINEQVPLLANYQHSKDAHAMWRRLVATQDVTVLYSNNCDDNEFKMELSIDKAEWVMSEPGFHVLLNRQLMNDKFLPWKKSVSALYGQKLLFGL